MTIAIISTLPAILAKIDEVIATLKAGQAMNPRPNVAAAIEEMESAKRALSGDPEISR